MNNIDFDRRIKELMDSCQEPVGEDLWGGIERGLVRKRAMIWFRRAGYAAVAASLAVGIILNVTPSEELVQGGMAVKVIASPSVEAGSAPVPVLAALNVAERPEVEGNVQAAVAVDTDELLRGEADVPQEEKEIIIKETKETKQTESREEHSDNHINGLMSEPYAADDDWIYEEEESRGRGVVLGISSNMLALGGNGFSGGSVQYMPGSSMMVQNGIVPITEPSFSLPVTFGLQVQFPLGERLAIGTGLNYTYLRNSFQALIDNSVQAMVDQKLHYIGLPLSLFVKILDNGKFMCYANAGGTMEKGLQVSSRFKDIKDGITYFKEGIKGLQWSVNIGVGLQYSFSDLVALYFDPGLVYFFDAKQPFSVRTSQPLQFDMELGFRFNL